MGELKDLQPLAKQLNTASDELNVALEAIQTKLNALALGVEAWLDEGDEELSRRISSTWMDPATQAHRRSVEAHELGYGRFGDGWGFLVRKVTYTDEEDEGFPDTWGIVGDAEEGERTLLLRSPRQFRVAAVDLIPRLIDVLKNEASKVVGAVEKAKRLAQTLK